MIKSHKQSKILVQKNIIMSLMMTTLLLTVTAYSDEDSYDYEYDYNKIVSELETNMSELEPPKFATSFYSSEFENNAYSLRGRMFAGQLSVYKPGVWMLGLEVPYLTGVNYQTRSEEIGNIQFKSRFEVWQVSEHFSMWIPFSLRMAQRGRQAVLASHHDTYRAGIDMDYVKGRIVTTMGFGFNLRTLEEDPKFDIGDIYDIRAQMKIGITNRVTAKTQFDWYRVLPTKIQKKALTNTVDWAAIRPGLIFHVLNGLDLYGDVTVPVLQSATPLETDLAFGEIYYPQTSHVTLNWGLGASF